MGLFEFLMVLVSVVIGLGITEVLTGWAGMLRERATIRPYWMHVLFQAGVFMALLQQWWEFWDLSDVDQLTFPAVLAILATPVVLFLVAHLLFPDDIRGADLRAYYFEQAGLLWGLVILGAAAGTFLEPIALGYPIFLPENLSGIPLIACCIVLMRTKRPAIHGVVGPIVLLLVVLDTVLSNPAISNR